MVNVRQGAGVRGGVVGCAWVVGIRRGLRGRLGGKMEGGWGGGEGGK